MLIPKFIFWEFKIHNGVTAVLDFRQRLANKLLVQFKVVTSWDKYLPLIFHSLWCHRNLEVFTVWPREDHFKSTALNCDWKGAQVGFCCQVHLLFLLPDGNVLGLSASSHVSARPWRLSSPASQSLPQTQCLPLELPPHSARPEGCQSPGGSLY